MHKSSKFEERVNLSATDTPPFLPPVLLPPSLPINSIPVGEWVVYVVRSTVVECDLLA